MGESPQAMVQRKSRQETCKEEECEFREFTNTPGQQDQIQDVDEPIKEPIGASVQQEQTQGAEDQFIQDLISSPDKIRVRERKINNTSNISILTWDES